MHIQRGDQVTATILNTFNYVLRPSICVIIHQISYLNHSCHKYSQHALDKFKVFCTFIYELTQKNKPGDKNICKCYISICTSRPVGTGSTIRSIINMSRSINRRLDLRIVNAFLKITGKHCSFTYQYKIINVQEICLYIFNRELLFNHEALLDVGLCAIRCEFFHDIFYY